MTAIPSNSTRRARAWLVSRVYARHNQAPAVRSALREVLWRMQSPGARGLNLGAGATRLHPRMLRVDIDPAARPEALASALELPFADDSFDVVVSQEVFEHLPDPWGALREVRRTLKPGGRLYLQVPFVIGYHAGPADYWRFTHQGLERLLEGAGFQIDRLETAVGAGTGVYRIAAELCAVVAGAVWTRAYLPTKALAAVLLSPLRLLDRLPLKGQARYRIPGGFLALASKPSAPS